METKKKRGRPATGRKPAGTNVRISAEMTEQMRVFLPLLKKERLGHLVPFALAVELALKEFMHSRFFADEEMAWKFVMAYDKAFICPECKNVSVDFPATSRRDDKTQICPECGTKEAFEDYVRFSSASKIEREKEVLS